MHSKNSFILSDIHLETSYTSLFQQPQICPFSINVYFKVSSMLNMGSKLMILGSRVSCFTD